MKIILLTYFFLSLFTAFQAVGMEHSGSKQSLVKSCLQAAALPSPHCGRAPSSIFSRDGNLHVVFSQNGHVYYTTSSDQGKTFKPSTAVNRTPEKIYDDGENRPKIKLGKNHEIYISWTHKTPGRYSGDVRFTRSLDGGKSFDVPMTINSDRAIISHRFETMIVDNDGKIFLIWIDKRDKLLAQKHAKEYAGVALYFAVSDNLGASFKANKKLVDNSCECCRIATDKDEQGNIVAMWRHIYPTNIRDHAIAYVSENMQTIKGSPMKATNDEWKIEGCPHHGPDIAIDAKNQVHMAWFSQGNRNKGLTYGRFDFEDQITHFEMSINNTPAASRPQVFVSGSKVFLMWKQFNGQDMQLLNQYSKDEGQTWTTPIVIATTNNDSDHPDWVALNNKLFASWHTQSEGLTMVQVK